MREGLQTVARLLLIAILTAGCGGNDEGSTAGAPSALGSDYRDRLERFCVRVIDGDTIVLDGGEKVRYIGINTPETKHPRKPVQRMGKEASEANRILVEGKQVGLEYDAERTDR